MGKYKQISALALPEKFACAIRLKPSSLQMRRLDETCISQAVIALERLNKNKNC